ncbi:MAG: ComF family protein [Hyphomicrobium sp.]|nr:ComF family protein [Hyphomicrobium sp.]
MTTATGDTNSCDATGDVSAEETGTSRRVAGARARFRRFGRTFLDVLLPPLCLACETRILSHDSLCPSCWRRIDFIRQPLCDRLGLPLPYGSDPDDSGDAQPLVSALAIADPPIYARARAVARFDGLMRDLVHDLKYQDNPNCRRLFGRWLSEAGRDVLVSADAIVPVPLGRFRLVSRRFNQAQILASAISSQCNIPVWTFALRRSRATTRQVGLSRDQRRRNVAGAFTVPRRAARRLAGRNIVLIDDVITTGATVSAAAKALMLAGAHRVDVLSLALVCDPHG